MGGLCGGSRATRRTPRERARQRTGAEDAVRRGQVTRRTGLDAIVNDIAMDTGLRQPDTEYYSRLNERQRRSQQALADMRERRRKRNDNKVTTTTDTTTDTTDTTTDTDTTATTTTTATTPTPPPAPPPFTETVDTGADTTYKGGDVSVGDVIDNRVVTSETEADAIESTGKGRVSTIATSPRGLLGIGRPGQTRRRRSLMGGGLIR
tara:strand:- start:144 stop:764 length:621 start_codon:yes stop_codon:yes gene_type:complete